MATVAIGWVRVLNSLKGSLAGADTGRQKRSGES
jgi:hypothetical protein